MKGLFIPDITAEMFRNGCLESIEALMAEGKIYDIDYSPWIPCSERLPEENGVYIISYEDAVTWLEWFNGKWFFYPSNPAREETGTIIAWMPLPQTYKQEVEK